MDEDAAYRASSQYRLWSFTPSQLRDRRTETNQFAAEKVRASFARANSNQHERESSPEAKAISTTKSRDALTVDEEQVIVQWGCSKIIEMKDHLDPRPSSVIIVSLEQHTNQTTTPTTTY
jgi:cyclin H